MSFFNALRIAGSALTAQRLRTDVIANNIANMNTTRTAEGGPYRRQQLVFTPRQEQVPFRTILLAQGVVNIPSPTGATMPPGQGVRVSRVGPDDRPARRTYEPDHPDADAEGFVGYPDIDPVTEMADMLSATRALAARRGWLCNSICRWPRSTPPGCAAN